MAPLKTLQAPILAMRIIALTARMDVARSAVGGDARGDRVAGGWGDGTCLGEVDVVVGPARRDGGDGVVDCRPGFQAGGGGGGGVCWFGEGWQDFSWAGKMG